MLLHLDPKFGMKEGSVTNQNQVAVTLTSYPFPTYNKSAADDFEIIYANTQKSLLNVDIITEKS